MLALILLWVALAAGTYALGAHALSWLDARRTLDRVADHAVIAVLAGVLIFGAILTVVALFGPVTPLAGSLVLLAAVFALLARAPLRADAMTLGRALARPAPLFLGVIALLATALVASDPVTWYDSGLYHYPLVKWLREYGVVTGLGLLHDAFGQSSIWYPLSAFLSGGPLHDRIGSVWSSLLFLLAIGYLGAATARIAEKRARPVDWFVAVSLALLALAMIPPIRSTSPDVPLLLLPIATLAAIQLGEEGRRRHALSDLAAQDARLLPLILGAGTAAVKLNGIPLLAVTALWYAGWPWRFGRIVRGAVISIALLVPGIAMSLKSTGCPLFPSAAGCLRTAWSFDPAYIDYARRVFAEFLVRGGTFMAPLGSRPGEGLSTWIAANHLGLLGIGVALIAAAILLTRSRITSLPGGGVALVYVAVGIFYVLAMAPATRYMLGMLVVAPALIAAWLATRVRARSARPDARSVMLRRVPGFALLALCGWTMLQSQRFNPRTAIKTLDLRRSLMIDSFPLFRPPPFPTPPLYARHWNDIAYVSPVDTTRVPGNQLRNYTGLFDENVVTVRCGAAPLPCTPYFPYDDVVLRDPVRGLAGGFVRRNPSAPGHAFIGLRSHRLLDGQPTSSR